MDPQVTLYMNVFFSYNLVYIVKHSVEHDFKR